MGGGIAFFVASICESVALPLAKDPNHRTLPEVINSIKAIPNADNLIFHPILAEAILETYGKNDSPELEYLRRLGGIDVGGGKLASSVANELRDMRINIVSGPTKKCQHFALPLVNIYRFSNRLPENLHCKY